MTYDRLEVRELSWDHIIIVVLTNLAWMHQVKQSSVLRPLPHVRGVNGIQNLPSSPWWYFASQLGQDLSNSRSSSKRLIC